MVKIKLLTGVMLLSMLALLLGACAPQPLPTPSPAPTPEPSPAPSPTQPPAPSPIPAPAPAPTPQLSLGTVEVYVTDAPPGQEITAVLLTISSLEIHRAAAEQEQEQEQEGSDNETQEREQEQEQEQEGQGEWIAIEISGDMATFDLLKVKGIEEFFGDAEVEEGKYTQIRLTVEEARVALNGGEPQEAKVPSDEVKIVRPFDVKAGETTAILLDFDAEHSVIITGADNIQVKPVVKLSIEQKGQSGKTEDKEKDDEEDENKEEEPGEEISLEVSCEEFQSGKHISREIDIPVGGMLVITLCSNPTTGFQWSETANISDTAVLKQVSHEFIPSQGANQTGAAGKEIWSFRALSEGESLVSFEYSRPWQGGEKGEWTFELEVEVE